MVLINILAPRVEFKLRELIPRAQGPGAPGGGEPMSNRGISGVMALILLGVVSCAPPRKTPAAAPVPGTDWASKLQEADSLYAEASYLALSRALLVLQNVLAVPEWRGAASERYIRTALALGLRESELGMPGKRTPGRLSSLDANEPAAAPYGPFVELLAFLPSQIKGVAGDNLPGGRTLDEYFDWLNAHVPALDQDLKERAESDDLMACFRAAALVRMIKSKIREGN